jgi:hypothetical protein
MQLGLIRPCSFREVFFKRFLEQNKPNMHNHKNHPKISSLAEKPAINVKQLIT